MSDDSVSPASRVPLPEALELVDATEVGSLLVETERELRALEAEAERLVAAAQEAEAVAADAQADPATTTWMLVRLQRFVDALRAEAARDAETIVEVARHHAQARGEGPLRRPQVATEPEPPPAGSAIPALPVALIVPDLAEAPSPAPV
ncbi:MAG: hypothetical protein EBU70_14175, partial [Actinobacteria bacterium]|nr:hypothetical protein [Actinomycetota bacterium]